MRRGRAAPPRAPRWALAATILAALAVLATYSGHLDGPVDRFHEGERVAHIDTLRAGGLPFRDAYVPHGLGEDILKPLAARWLFGDTLAAQRRLGQNAFIYRGWLPPLGALGLVLAAIAITRRPLAGGIALGLLAFGLFEVTERQFLGMASVACLGIFLRSRHEGWLLASGVLTSLASIYSLEVGLYAAAAGLAWLSVDAWIRDRARGRWWLALLRRDGWMLGGVVIGAAPLLLWCAWRGILGDLLTNIRIQLFLRDVLFPMAYPGLAWVSGADLTDNLLVAAQTGLLFYVMPLLYAGAIGLALLSRGDDVLRSGLALVSWVGAAFYVSVWGRPDVWHVAFATAGFFLFAAAALVVLPHLEVRRGIQWIGLASVGAVAGAALWVGYPGAFGASRLGLESPMLPPALRSIGRPARVSTIPRLAGVSLPSDEADYLDAVVGHLQARTSPADTFLDLTDQAVFYYLAERRSPTRFALLSYCGTPELRERMVRDVEGRDRWPLYVVVDLRRPLPPDALGRFVNDHYREESRIGPIAFLRRAA